MEVRVKIGEDEICAMSCHFIDFVGTSIDVCVDSSCDIPEIVKQYALKVHYAKDCFESTYIRFAIERISCIVG